jgi:hypothetical protein
MNEVILKLSTHVSDGTATTLAEHAILGELYAVEYHPGTIDTGATLTITCQGNKLTSAVAEKPVLAKATAGTSISWYYPRDLVHGVADGVALTGKDGGDREKPVLNGVIKAAIASGGNSKVGYVIVYYED